MVQTAPSTYFRAFFDGVSFSAGDRILAANFAFGGCLSKRVAGAFFLVGTGFGLDSETNSSDPTSPSVDSSGSDSDSRISVGGGSFRDGAGLEGAGASPVPGVVQSSWLSREGSPLPLPCEKGRFR